ncbi:hypothetical protein AB0F88_39605 [Streptosporangium sp. NPDC023963]|uniref:hypothetical protein n=1 Tax=Streptosporangium sp. NPDC023963 TaxID=3155608 RepID=UPI0034162523
MSFLLFLAVLWIPRWIHDHRLDGLADRFLNHPPPPQTEVHTGEVDGSVGVEGRNKDLCRYRLRFTVETELSEDEVRAYYKKAKITPIEGDGRGILEVSVWTSPDRPPSLDTFGRQPMIVELQDGGHGQGWDVRCGCQPCLLTLRRSPNDVQDHPEPFVLPLGGTRPFRSVRLGA